MTDRFERIKEYQRNAHPYTAEFIEPKSNMGWLISEVEQLRKAAHADQVVIQRLRREVVEFRNEAGHARDELADFRRRVRNRRND